MRQTEEGWHGGVFDEARPMQPLPLAEGEPIGAARVAGDAQGGESGQRDAQLAAVLDLDAQAVALEGGAPRPGIKGRNAHKSTRLSLQVTTERLTCQVGVLTAKVYEAGARGINARPSRSKANEHRGVESSRNRWTQGGFPWPRLSSAPRRATPATSPGWSARRWWPIASTSTTFPVLSELPGIERFEEAHPHALLPRGKALQLLLTRAVNEVSTAYAEDADRTLRRIAAYVRLRYQDGKSVKDIAEAWGLDRTVLSRQLSRRALQVVAHRFLQLAEHMRWDRQRRRRSKAQ